jgi:hypothetical protein
MRVESMGENEVIAREVNLDMASDDASEKDKSKTGPWFEKHLKHYVMDDERDKAESQQAGEAAGMAHVKGLKWNVDPDMGLKRQEVSFVGACRPSTTQLMATKARIAVIRKMERLV